MWATNLLLGLIPLSAFFANRTAFFVLFCLRCVRVCCRLPSLGVCVVLLFSLQQGRGRGGSASSSRGRGRFRPTVKPRAPGAPAAAATPAAAARDASRQDAPRSGSADSTALAAGVAAHVQDDGSKANLVSVGGGVRCCFVRERLGLVFVAYNMQFDMKPPGGDSRRVLRVCICCAVCSCRIKFPYRVARLTSHVLLRLISEGTLLVAGVTAFSYICVRYSVVLLLL